MVESEPSIVFSAHALDSMAARGVSKESVERAIRHGTQEPAKRGRYQYTLNLEYNAEWCGKYYGVQQVVPIVVEDAGELVVITVYAFYFQEE